MRVTRDSYAFGNRYDWHLRGLQAARSLPRRIRWGGGRAPSGRLGDDRIVTRVANQPRIATRSLWQDSRARSLHHRFGFYHALIIGRSWSQG